MLVLLPYYADVKYVFAESCKCFICKSVQVLITTTTRYLRPRFCKSISQFLSLMELNKNYYIQTVTADRAVICITVVPLITKLPLCTIKIRRICKYCLENQYWYCNLLVHMERGLIWNFHQVIYFHRHLKYIVQNYCQIDHKERSFYFV